MCRVSVKRLTVFSVAMLLLLATPLTHASAAPPGADRNQDCVLAAGENQSPVCFSTAADALRYATGGRVNASESAGYAELKGAITKSNQVASAASADSARTTVVIAVQCVYTGFSTCLSFTDSTACPGHSAKVWPNFQSPWNNAFSSGYLLAGCAGTGYDSPTIGGAGGFFNFACEGSYSYYSGFDNFESSFRAFNGGC
jgi:hypothetical protein